MKIALPTKHPTTRRLARASLNIYRPPPRITISEWADAERMLSPESCASPGPWETWKVEYLRGIMDAASDPLVKSVVAVCGSQVGKTDCVNNIIGYHMRHDPGPMLLLQPTVDMAQAWSKDRLAPMLRDTPTLRGLVRDPRSRDSGNMVLHKIFPGGHITAAGANSPASLSSRPIRILICDEVDRYPASAGTEGNPVKLAETRTVSFWNNRRFYISSPTFKGSAMDRLWEGTDQRRYFVPCHECGKEQFLKWDQVGWAKTPKGDPIIPIEAWYTCEHCGAKWTDAQRINAVRRGRWIATAPFNGAAGFHLPALAAPWEDRKLPVLVKLWYEAQGNPDDLKVFVNTIMAEWWEEKYSSLDDSELMQRREPYPRIGSAIVTPKSVVVMTAGVDVQDDRIEVQIQGYGRGRERWQLQYHVLEGDPSGPHIWSDLWELLQNSIAMERGGHDFIRATCVDTGTHTLRAYEFCRRRFRYATRDGRLAYCFAIKGDDGPGTLWPREPSRNNKGKIPLYTIKVDTAKESLYAALDRIETPGPGYIHFPLETTVGLPFEERYFEQLTAEKVVDRRSRGGFSVRVWEKKSPGRRNEALDTAVYADAALHGLFSLGFDLDREAGRVERLIGAPPPPAVEIATPAPKTIVAANTERPKPKHTQSNWLRSGRVEWE